MKSSRLAALCLAALSVTPSAANAHIKLLRPASWVTTDATGNPQKMGPCGTSSAGSAATNQVTTFEAGEEITVEWNETVDHPGHFRIALATDRGDLKDPALKPPAGSCDYPADSVPTGPHDNVLLDNLFPASAYGGAKTFSQKVKLPDQPCEKCTLQLIQWMTKHAPPCVYYQCADIRIVAPDAPAAGSGGASAAGSGAAGSASGPTTPAAESDESEGCSMTRLARPRSCASGLVLLLGIALLAARRSRRSR